MGDRDLPTTAGALGNEKPKRPKRWWKLGDSRDDEGRGNNRRKRSRKETEIVTNKPSTRRPNQHWKIFAVVQPFTSIWTWPWRLYLLRWPVPITQAILIHSLFALCNSFQFSWMYKQSLSLVLFMLYPNPNLNPNGNEQERAVNWATQALTGNPQIWIDPDMMGNGFFTRAKIVINNLPVPTNSANYDHWLHYCHCNRILKQKTRILTLLAIISFILPLMPTELQPLTRLWKKVFADWTTEYGILEQEFILPSI